MQPCLFLLFGLLILGMVIAQAHATGNNAACTRALRQAFAASPNAATLPAPCRHIGPVTLGLQKDEVLAALGQPDATRGDAKHPDTLRVMYLYPRDLKARLAQHPLPLEMVGVTSLTVSFRNDQVINVDIFASVSVPVPFNLLDQPVGTHVDRILQAIGGSPQGNSSRDYIQFSAMPLSLLVDPDTSAVVGLDIADNKDDLYNFGRFNLILLKDPKSGLINGVR
ncbi:secreted signal peptide protein [Xanthomonas maliensis]|uniref:secreted signal peptide protein n=2 Tax=Xanthomonas maliensis TaxID=1321368 RepID=UPI0012644620|nr:secreted signal peptide protein [Xanthomonas maliensis]KAB7766371.1 secreted signal peptide protein [Xanthomonas maliensis]